MAVHRNTPKGFKEILAVVFVAGVLTLSGCQSTLCGTGSRGSNGCTGCDSCGGDLLGGGCHSGGCNSCGNGGQSGIGGLLAKLHRRVNIGGCDGAGLADGSPCHGGLLGRRCNHGGPLGDHFGRHHHGHQSHLGPQPGPANGPPAPTVTYPYYTTRAPRDFLSRNPASIGP